MKKLDLGQTITILANVGVVAGIVFLGLELRQNNQFLGAESRYNLLQNRQNVHLMVIQDDDVADLLVKARTEQELTETENEQLRWYYVLMLASWDYDYQQYRDGLVDEDVVPTRQWVRSFKEDRRFFRFWQDTKEDYSADFVAWMDENIVNER